jgi:hypothetical protein
MSKVQAAKPSKTQTGMGMENLLLKASLAWVGTPLMAIEGFGKEGELG